MNLTTTQTQKLIYLLTVTEYIIRRWFRNSNIFCRTRPDAATRHHQCCACSEWQILQLSTM